MGRAVVCSAEGQRAGGDVQNGTVRRGDRYRHCGRGGLAEGQGVVLRGAALDDAPGEVNHQQAVGIYSDRGGGDGEGPAGRAGDRKRVGARTVYYHTGKAQTAVGKSGARALYYLARAPGTGQGKGQALIHLST